MESLCEEKIFNKQSFGFRPNRSAHHALKSAKEGMEGVTWIIEGRIKRFFDNIDLDILVNIIKTKLNPDRTLIGIFYKLLKAGYLVNPYSDIYRDCAWRGKVSSNIVGGITSPILFNMYLTPLDEFMDKLQENYGRSPFHAKIHYVRFADEWVIGVGECVAGSRYDHNMLAKKIQEQVKAFLVDELKLELDKHKLTHLGRGCGKFLAHYLRWPLVKVGAPGKLSSTPNSGLVPGNYYRPSVHGETAPIVLIPCLNDIKSQLIKKGFANDSGYPKYVGRFLHLSDYDIVKNYDCLVRNILIFYNLSGNRTGLSELFYILEYSLAHTLAAKHRSTLTKIFKKYGKPIAACDDLSGTVKFSWPSYLKAYQFNRHKEFNVELERWQIEYRTDDPISMLVDYKNFTT